ncbi:MAG: hypothetical protein MHMPM18_003291 [Marteilia pararefringens]
MKFFERNQSIYLFGTSEAPWEGDKKSMASLFDKTISLPMPSIFQLEQYIIKFFNKKLPIYKEIGQSLTNIGCICEGLTFKQLDSILRIIELKYLRSSEKIKDEKELLNSIEKEFIRLQSRLPKKDSIEIAKKCFEWTKSLPK